MCRKWQRVVERAGKEDGPWRRRWRAQDGPVLRVSEEEPRKSWLRFERDLSHLGSINHCLAGQRCSLPQPRTPRGRNDFAVEAALAR